MMQPLKFEAFFFLLFVLLPIANALETLPAPQTQEQSKPWRIFIVSSYHREYLWSEDTNKGVIDTLSQSGYFETQKQIDDFNKNDFVITKKMILQKYWMDTKHKNKTSEIALSANEAIDKINAFKPDIILLGDDNAANWIGNEFIDTDVPVVFWGVNGTPVKYGLLNTKERPGHNITGIYQAGYMKESIELLQTLVPDIKKIAVISDDSTTGRSKVREVLSLIKRKITNLELVDSIHTDDYQQWKDSFLRLQSQVDAFIIFNHNSLKESGKTITQMQAGRWYLKHINKPECSHEAQFVLEGLLCATDDSGYKQGAEAVRIALRILEKGEDPAGITAYAPSRGAYMVNQMRAKQLGIKITPAMGVEKIINTSKALE